MVGAVIGMIFYGLLMWGDLEASLFHSPSMDNDPLESLECPQVLTRNESGTVETRVTNTLERQIRARVRTTISEGSVLVIRQDTASADLAPGEAKTFSWTIQPEDAVWDRFVFANVYSFPVYPIPARSGACSTLVVDVPGIPGNTLAVLIMLSAAGLMIGGLWLWVLANRPLQGRDSTLMSGMIFIFALIAIGTFLALRNMWLASGLVLIANLLSSVVLLAYKFTTD